jgi:Family of unknown function (DUF5988)
MSNPSDAQLLSTNAHCVIDVVLEGGPIDLPHDERTRRVWSDERKIKVRFYGGYEHFERGDSAIEGITGPIVFRWTGRTRIAE